jgi:serine/threonine protein kinase
VEPGRVLADRYEIQGPIAEGSGSTVWEARDRATGDTVAVKTVSLERAGWRAEVRDRFQQEARLLTLVRHRHVVAVRDVGETDDGYLYVVLDRLSGETLASRLARPPRLAWRDAAAIALELAEGLAALHARGVVHRDLKPANVILHRDGAGPGAAPVCKIIDLGISKVRAAAADPVLFATLTATGQVLGTPEYMSYEQAVGERDVDARTDVWALGVVLHEMLSGCRPFTGGNVNAVLAAIRKQPPAPLATVARGTPDALAGVVLRCLDPSRDGRYRDGEALGSALRAAVAQGDREETRVARRKLLAIAAGAALVAAAVSVGVATLGHRPPPPATAAPATVDPSSAPLPVAIPPSVPALAPTPSTGSPATVSSSPAPAKSGRPVTRIKNARF